MRLWPLQSVVAVFPATTVTCPAPVTATFRPIAVAATPSTVNTNDNVSCRNVIVALTLAVTCEVDSDLAQIALDDTQTLDATAVAGNLTSTVDAKANTLRPTKVTDCTPVDARFVCDRLLTETPSALTTHESVPVRDAVVTTTERADCIHVLLLRTVVSDVHAVDATELPPKRANTVVSTTIP